MAVRPRTVDASSAFALDNLVRQETVLALSDRLDEPAWLREQRLDAWDKYLAAPPPRWQRGIRGWWVTDLTSLRIENMAAYAEAGVCTIAPSAVGQREKEVAGYLAQRNAQTTLSFLLAGLRQKGVYFGDLPAAVHEQPDLVRHYLGLLVRPEDDKFAALATALWSNGVFVYVPEGVEVTLPLQALLSLEAGDLALSRRTVLVAERGSSVTYVDEVASAGCATGSLSAGTVEVYVGEGASVTVVSTEDWNESTTSVLRRRARVERDGELHWVAAYLGGGISRGTADTVLAGPGARTTTIGLFFANGHQRLDLNSYTSHEAPHTENSILLNGVVKDAAHAAYAGTIRVNRGAQQANSQLTTHTLTLSDEARVDAVPSLEIEANEVQVGHGATAGKLDEDQVFYLMTRGLNRQQATETLVRGFFEPVLSRVPLDSVRERVERTIEGKMRA